MLLYGPHSQSCDDVGAIAGGFAVCFLAVIVLDDVVGRSAGGSETVSCLAFSAAIAASCCCLAAA